MQKYIWLNPVVLKMYDEEELNNVLTSLGFQIVTCEENHIVTVKNKYKDQPKFGCSYLSSSDLIQMKIAYAITSA